jgi:hypothetical protein
VTHDIPHDLTVEQARSAARKAVEAYGEQFKGYSFSANWVNEDCVEIGFAIRGKRMDGSLRVTTRALKLELTVPFIFRVFSGQAIRIIEREALVWIDRARKGEFDA